MEPLPDALEQVIVPRSRDLGDGLHVLRALPAHERRMVGPFVFFDQMGPARFDPGRGADVRPHPHIGLATVTYLFDGAILHRDSLGSVQRIEPGAVNWMTAGAGIVHSERTPPEERASGGKLCGLQLWVALPKPDEEMAPSFQHTPSDALPLLREPGRELRLIVGTLLGARSPVATRSPMFYADLKLEPGGTVALPAEHDERAVYVLEGELELDGHVVPAGQLLVLKRGAEVRLAARAPTRAVALGGATMDGPRNIVWNFVSSSRERIREAARAWTAQEFPRVPGETEWVPLPTGLPLPAHDP